ncbi:MAG TPA: MerR family DNA-binding transcriptional regulator [Xanthobacteraceae bacterium]|nr:MerR family DNA-binding transcriptional regulator [Xanthobacteraceae bacterium]
MRETLDSAGNKRSAPRSDLASGFAPEYADASPKESFRIRDLSREFGVTARTLRFYEECELLAPRREGQDRIYSRRDRARLKLVLLGKKVGFSLEEIRAMLDLYDLGDGQATQLKVAAKRFQEQIERLKNQRRDIDTAVAELERASEIIAQRLAERT